MLFDIQKELKIYEVVEDIEEAPAEEAGDDGASEGDASASAPAARRGGRAALDLRSITSISTREDALYMLELVSNYFRTAEPSSPLPMLIDRARRLSAMDFMQILRNLAPDGLNQAQNIAGPQDEDGGYG